jgi:hypothetical protein
VNGVVSFKLTAGEALNFAIPINYAQDILKTLSESKPLISWSKSGRSIFNNNSALEIPSNKPTSNLIGLWKSYVNTSDGFILETNSSDISINENGGKLVIEFENWSGDRRWQHHYDCQRQDNFWLCQRDGYDNGYIIVKPINKNLIEYGYIRLEGKKSKKNSSNEIGLEQAKSIAAEIYGRKSGLEWRRKR